MERRDSVANHFTIPSIHYAARSLGEASSDTPCWSFTTFIMVAHSALLNHLLSGSGDTCHG